MRWHNVAVYGALAIVCFFLGISFSRIVRSDEGRWVGKRVLILGDSLVGEGSGLEMGLRKRLKDQGAYVDTMASIGGRASSWAKDEKLSEQLSGWLPHAVVVALGMNSCRTPPQTYGRHVKALARRLKGKECYWIGPPLLVEGTAPFLIALPKAVKENSSCRFFDTVERVTFPVGSVSGFHIRRWKGKGWAKQVWGWMNE